MLQCASHHRSQYMITTDAKELSHLTLSLYSWLNGRRKYIIGTLSGIERFYFSLKKTWRGYRHPHIGISTVAPFQTIMRSARSFKKNFPNDLLDPEQQALLSHPGSPESQKPVWQERSRTSICCLLGSPELPMRPPYQAFFCSSAMMQAIT